MSSVSRTIDSSIPVSAHDLLVLIFLPHGRIVTGSAVPSLQVRLLRRMLLAETLNEKILRFIRICAFIFEDYLASHCAHTQRDALVVEVGRHLQVLVEGARHVEGNLALTHRALDARASLLATQTAHEVPARVLKIYQTKQ